MGYSAMSRAPFIMTLDEESDLEGSFGGLFLSFLFGTTTTKCPFQVPGFFISRIQSVQSKIRFLRFSLRFQPFSHQMLTRSYDSDTLAL